MSHNILEIYKKNKHFTSSKYRFKHTSEKKKLVNFFKMFRALADENINILAISTSEIKISVIINENDTLKAVKKSLWFPARQRDKKVGVWITIPIDFSLK